MAARRLGSLSVARTADRLDRIAEQLTGLGDQAEVGGGVIHDLSDAATRIAVRLRTNEPAERRKSKQRTSAFVESALDQMFGRRR